MKLLIYNLPGDAEGGDPLVEMSRYQGPLAPYLQSAKLPGQGRFEAAASATTPISCSASVNQSRKRGGSAGAWDFHGSCSEELGE